MACQRKNLNHSTSVAAFFDNLAPQYDQKWKNPFLRHFFQQRMEIACRNLEFSEKKILDLGAGTGALYTYLSKMLPFNPDYWGLDFSTQMLAHSSIPSDRQLIGNALHLPAMSTSFDLIFALGLTTYIRRTDFSLFLHHTSNLLRTHGRAIISFTNKKCLPVHLRKHLARCRSLLPRNTLLGASFQFTAISPEHLIHYLPPDLKIIDLVFFAPSFVPSAFPIPKIVCQQSRLLEKSFGASPIFPLLATEFILFVQKT